MSEEKDNPITLSPTPIISKSSGVRRVNNVPLFIVVGILVIFSLLVIFAIFKSADAKQGKERQDVMQVQRSSGADTSTLASQVMGKHKTGGLIPPDALAPPSLSAAQPSTSRSLSAGESANVKSYSGDMAGDEGEDPAILAEKMKQLREAIRSKSKVNVSFPQVNSPAGNASRPKGIASLTPSTASTGAVAASTAAPGSPEEMMDRLSKLQQQLPSLGVGGLAGIGDPKLLAGLQAPAPSKATSGNDVQQFDSLGQGGDRWKLDSETQNPRTLYEIRAGAVIPGVMISGIQSDLPGQIMGQVSQDVYDTATGKYMLIPQGTRLVGTYNSSVAFGQSSLLIAWQRLVFPDGKALDIGSMPGADMAGYAGFRDQINNHYLRIYSSAILLSGVTAATSHATRDQSNNFNPYGQPSLSSEMNQALGQQLGQVTSQMISKNMNIAPTIEIRPGYRFNIVVVKDLDFKSPYKSFDYQ